MNVPLKSCLNYSDKTRRLTKVDLAEITLLDTSSSDEVGSLNRIPWDVTLWGQLSVHQLINLALGLSDTSAAARRKLFVPNNAATWRTESIKTISQPIYPLKIPGSPDPGRE